ncbi:MAG: transglutaminase family protein [Rhodobacteraceae bacterium]|jgi:transglutaminase-like putative cysteine protease|nr:transglutaminase family protein [Paracoccaceae bacterium]
MRYRLHLEIRYSFGHVAAGGRQLLRVLPALVPGRQQVAQCRLATTPVPLEERRFRDFFGTEAIEIVLPGGLTDLLVEMTAEVARTEAVPAPDISAPPEAMAAELAAVASLAPDSPYHFLSPSPRVPEVPQIAQFAREAAAGAATLAEAVARLGQALNRTIAFDPRATEVDTPIAQAFRLRRGVCQDMAQIMISGLRSQGIPAAYVAGYLRTRPPPGRPRLVGADAMHAWVRAWCGHAAGWIDYDPTNACRVNGDHVEVGFGRDYGDVAPVTGSLRLEGGQSGSHSVDIAEI